MRILFLTNYYPPCQYGWGYMQLCEEVVNGLSAKGHTVIVLTSTYRHGDEVPRTYPVHRLLHIEPDWHNGRSAAWQFFMGRRQREKQAITHLRQLVAEFCPEIIFVWHAIGLPRLLLQTAEQIPGITVAYYLAGYLPELRDEYITYWQAESVRPIARLLKCALAKLALRLLEREGKPVDLKYKNVICVSDYVRSRLLSKGLISKETVVIHNGVDCSLFVPNGHNGAGAELGSLHCLVAGHIKPEKGVHTVIEALGCLKAQNNANKVTLTILGDGPPDYLDSLQRKVLANHLQDIVSFLQAVPREQMPGVLGHYNTLILPSEYDEPLARAMQEAMAMGLLVIGTTTGGSGELLVHQKTGLVFEAGNPQSLAMQLSWAMKEPELIAGLVQAGRREIEKNFNIQGTVERVEDYLLCLLKY